MFTFVAQSLRQLKNDSRGVTIIEYALLAGLIGVALMATLTSLKQDIATMLVAIGTSL
jgi:Flp pilus assembly pilin Flp